MINHSLLLLALLMIFLKDCESRSTWDYELISISSYSKDESKFEIHTKIERDQYNELSYTVNMDWKFDVKDTDMFEVSVLRSPSGQEKDFRPIPFEIPTTSFNEVIEKYYKDLIHANLKHCSNLYPYEEIANRPWPKQKYILERCVVTKTGFPEIMPEGTYKMQVVFTGTVEWALIFVVRVYSKLIP